MITRNQPLSQFLSLFWALLFNLPSAHAQCSLHDRVLDDEQFSMEYAGKQRTTSYFSLAKFEPAVDVGEGWYRVIFENELGFEFVLEDFKEQVVPYITQCDKWCCRQGVIDNNNYSLTINSEHQLQAGAILTYIKRVCERRGPFSTTYELIRSTVKPSLTTSAYVGENERSITFDARLYVDSRAPDLPLRRNNYVRGIRFDWSPPVQVPTNLWKFVSVGFVNRNLGVPAFSTKLQTTAIDEAYACQVANGLDILGYSRPSRSRVIRRHTPMPIQRHGSATGAWCRNDLGHVILGGKMWRQPVDTKGFTYDEVASELCNVATGRCSGTKRGVDFSGWRWATIEESLDIYKSLGILPLTTRITDDHYIEHATEWAPAFIDIDPGGEKDSGVFDVIYANNKVYSVWGYTRTPSDRIPGTAYASGINDHHYTDDAWDNVGWGDGYRRNANVDNGFGMWLYRDVDNSCRPRRK